VSASMPWRLRGTTLEPSPARPLLMGIVNASPDSFSERGETRTAEELFEHARELVAAGAALIDVGGESGRTDRAAVAPEQEAERVVPVVERLAGEGVLASVDTWRAPVARAALAAGAALINDPSGLGDPEVASACAEAGAGLVVTHTRVEPKQKRLPARGDVLADAPAFLGERIEAAVGRGVDREGIAVDPGLDLGKTPAESIELLRSLDVLVPLGRPILLAASRKDFIGALTGGSPATRLAGTLAAIEAGLSRGASVLRVHDVAETADYLRVRAALRGEAAVPDDLCLDEKLRRENGERAA
jgi:dihydropteroate synthase